MSGRTWILSELYYPEESATGHYLTGIAEYLAKDRPVAVVCCRPNYSDRSGSHLSHEVHNGVEIFRCWFSRLNKNRYLFRVVNILSATVSLSFKLFSKVRRNDHVLVVTNPPLLPFLVCLVSKLKGARCVLRIDDVYPDNMVVAGVLRKGSASESLLNALTRALYRSVDHLVVLGRDMKELVEAKAEGAKHKTSVITNWADTSVVFPEDKATNPLRLKYGLKDRFVVGYAGNVGPLQGIDTLLRCMILMREYERVHFLVIGGGKSSPALKQGIATERLTNVTMTGELPRNMQRDFLNAFDVGLVPLAPGMRGAAVPSRLYNLLAAGKPIIAVMDEDTEVALTVREERLGWVVPPGRADLLARTIQEASSAELSDINARSRRLAEERFSAARVCERYRTLLGTI